MTEMRRVDAAGGSDSDHCWAVALAVCLNFDAVKVSEFLGVLAAANQVAQQCLGYDAFGLILVSDAGGSVRSNSMFSIETLVAENCPGQAQVAVFAGPADPYSWSEDCERLATWAGEHAPRLMSLGGGLDAAVDRAAVSSSRNRRSPADLALTLVQDRLGTDLRKRVEGADGRRKSPALVDVENAGISSEPRQGMRAEIAAVLAWVMENKSSPFEVEAMASVASMSLRNFRRVFTSEVGTSPSEYLDRCRLEAACRLLSETGLPLKAVARRSGFASERAMRRAFVQLHAMTPSDYRNRYPGAVASS